MCPVGQGAQQRTVRCVPAGLQAAPRRWPRAGHELERRSPGETGAVWGQGQAWRGLTDAGSKQQCWPECGRCRNGLRPPGRAERPQGVAQSRDVAADGSVTRQASEGDCGPALSRLQEDGPGGSWQPRSAPSLITGYVGWAPRSDLREDPTGPAGHQLIKGPDQTAPPLAEARWSGPGTKGRLCQAQARQQRHQSVSPGPASVSWTSKQPWEGRSSQLSTETSLRAERAFGRGGQSWPWVSGRSMSGEQACVS